MDSKTQESLENDFFTKNVKKFVFDIEKMKLCKNDEDRVKLALGDMNGSFCITRECSYGKKSSEESKKFGHSADLLLNSSSPDLEEVLKLYSKSILYAPPGSEQLSRAYANRSVVLFRGKYYEECLEDISRALNIGYPDSLKPKLLICRATCNYALSGNVDFETDEALIEARELIQKLPSTNEMRKMVEDTLNNPEKITSVGRLVKETCSNYQPEMKGKNPHLLGASDAIALKYSEEFGRHLVATRDIKSGEVLLIERPYAMIVPDEWIYCICSHCARSAWNGIPCDYCIYAMFCSAECKRAAWQEYHDVECEVLGTVKRIEVSDHMLMGLRMTVKAIREAGSLGALRKRLKELDSVEASDIEIPIDPNSYETFYIMSDNPEHHELEYLALLSMNAGILTYLLAVRTSLLGELQVGDLKLVEDSEKLLFVAGLIVKNIRIVQNRSVGQMVEEKPGTKEIVSLMAVSSFLNSRCYDAARLFRFGEDSALVTPVPISMGNQIFTNYYTNYILTSRDVRRQFLKDRWHFVCHCLACTEDWSDSSFTRNDQHMPSELPLDLFNKLDRVYWQNSEETWDSMELMPCREVLCELIDFLYPRVKKPCRIIEQFANLINMIYMTCSSTAFPRFVNNL